jgi:hypothetical protein
MVTNRSSRWKPLFDESDAQAVKAVVEQIAQAVAQDTGSLEGGLLTGHAGRALFFGYLAESWSRDDYAELAQQQLERALDKLPDMVELGLYEGLAGVAWTVQHLLDLEPGPNDGCGSIDRNLCRLVSLRPWPGRYELCRGLVGLGLYALERLPRPAAAECLAGIVDRLAEESIRQGAGITWLSKPQFSTARDRAAYPDGHYDLGVAHGVPAVVAVLAAACAWGVQPEKSRELYQGAVAWLLSQREPGAAEARFAAFANLEGATDGASLRPPRSAWCYGDPGVAAVLYAAARVVADDDLEAHALALARHATRRPVERCGVVDAPLCHGAAGLAQIYNRFWQSTGEPIFGEAARYWFGRTLAMQRPGCGVGGFSAWRPVIPGSSELGWVADPSLVSALGIALSLTASCTTVEPDWDRVMLLSLPPPQQTGGPDYQE